VLAGAIVLLLLVGTGLLIGTTLRVPTAPELVLSGYVVAFAEVIGLCLFLSLFDLMTRTALIAGTVLLFLAAVALWLSAGRPRFPSLERRVPIDVWRSRPLLATCTASALALAYVVALIVVTPPNGWDPLNYHLSRAAFWLQSGHVGYIDAAYDQRLNFNPPNGEIGFAFALGVTRQETFVGFVQFFGALACSLAIFCLARRLGLGRAEALFGSVLFLTLPIVLLQSSGAKNDIVVASFVLAACVFVLRPSHRELGLASIATALAIGTKFTAAYGLAILLALALVAPRREGRTRQVAAIALGAIAGSYWYLVNAIETGHLLGDQSNAGRLTAPLHPRENLLAGYGLAVDTLDLSGAQGRDLLLYVVAAVIVALGLALFAERTRRNTRCALGAGLIVASPLILLVLSTRLGRPSLIRLYDWLGKPDGYLAVGDDVASSPRTASDTASWFGPLGFLLVVGVGIVAFAMVRKGSLARAAGMAIAVPLTWFALVGLTLTYHPWQGRFFIVPVALSAVLWGLMLRSRATAWSAAAIAAVTMLLTLDHYVEKPSGLRLLERAPTASVWQMKRWQVQSEHDPALAPIFQFLDEKVPENDSIALALGPNEFGFPAFGPHLQRRVELVPFGSSASTVSARWLLADPRRSAELDSSCWHRALLSERGSVFRRERSGCPSA